MDNKGELAQGAEAERGSRYPEPSRAPAPGRTVAHSLLHWRGWEGCKEEAALLLCTVVPCLFTVYKCTCFVSRLYEELLQLRKG